MILKKFPFSISILLLILLFIAQSYKQKTQNNQKKQPDVAEINSFLAIGHKHYDNEEFDSSYYYYNKAKYTAELKKDTSRIIHSLAWMSQIQRALGDYSGSEATAVEALPFLENTEKYPNGKWNIYNTPGNNYLYTFDNDNALYYFKKALNLKTDQIDKAGIVNNIAITYIEMGDYQKALQILLPLIKRKEVIHHAETFARINDNLGDVYTKSGSPKAFYYLNQGLKIRLKIKDDWGLLSSYYHLSEYYKKSNPNLATAYAQLTYEKATEINSVDDRLRSLELLIKNSTGNKSRNFSLHYLHITDSINKVRQKSKNEFAKIKYDSKKQKEENLKLKTQKILQQEQQQKSYLILYFVVAIIILTSIFISNFLVAKNKREKIKTSYNTEIRIGKKLHDELANDVYHTMAFAETQDLSTSQNKEILLTSLDTIYCRTRNISKENSTVETGPFFVSSLKEMMSGFNTSTVNVLINGIDTINWTTLEDNKKITIYRVLQELLVNMKKHSQCSLAVITFEKNENKLQIDYTDDGVGTVFDKLNSKSGLQNVENRISAIKGTITFDIKSNKGFKASFTFPK
ncbi:tetratricopeptide repeat-containing sensor histidine kinase [Flavobacterium sp. ZS1P14]|uniref:tetratricopeptide repeat-containing sensor histidine kinase n=1 Tax=Flavobacterium sp. ZS1P14 TaxID=3401729 RepID=UPI003AAA2F13